MNIKKPQPDDTFVGDRTFAVAGTDEVYTEYGDAPQVTDKGPWTPSDDGRHIQSEDFEHDVTLRVSGDFATDEDRIAYTKWLAAKLNAAPPVPDGMVLVPEVLLRQIAKWLAESADPYDKAAYALNGLIAAAEGKE